MVDIGVYDFLEYFINRPSLILVIFLLYVFIYVLSVLLTGPKPGRNPFSVSHVKPVGDLVTDSTTRDRVIKQSKYIIYVYPITTRASQLIRHVLNRVAVARVLLFCL